ncbi:hypothetical protein IT409_03080 [Candidatus Falkowbacteria bacterium]|nr:hypothetical protein [Candidatus Falkowbacteria bacterium]
MSQFDKMRPKNNPLKNVLLGTLAGLGLASGAQAGELKTNNEQNQEYLQNDEKKAEIKEKVLQEIVKMGQEEVVVHHGLTGMDNASKKLAKDLLSNPLYRNNPNLFKEQYLYELDKMCSQESGISIDIEEQIPSINDLTGTQLRYMALEKSDLKDKLKEQQKILVQRAKIFVGKKLINSNDYWPDPDIKTVGYRFVVQDGLQGVVIHSPAGETVYVLN